jgi:hypothetical protein
MVLFLFYKTTGQSYFNTSREAGTFLSVTCIKWMVFNVAGALGIPVWQGYLGNDNGK